MASVLNDIVKIGKALDRSYDNNGIADLKHILTSGDENIALTVN